MYYATMIGQLMEMEEIELEKSEHAIVDVLDAAALEEG